VLYVRSREGIIQEVFDLGDLDHEGGTLVVWGLFRG